MRSCRRFDSIAWWSRRALCAVALAAAVRAQANAGIVPDAQISIATGGSSTWTFFATTAAFGPEPPSDSVQLRLALPPDSDPFSLGCGVLPAVAQGTAYVLARGNCSFSSKVLHAQAAGAAAVLILQTVPSLYGVANQDGFDPSNPTVAVNDTCAYWCPWGQIRATASDLLPSAVLAGLPELCPSSGCGTRVCVLTQGRAPDGSRTVCCATSDPMVMGAGPNDVSKIKIPALYVALQDAMQLLALMQRSLLLSDAAPALAHVHTLGRAAAQHSRALASDATCAAPRRMQSSVSAGVSSRGVPGGQWTTAMMWAIGCAAAVLASWKSAAPERQKLAAVMSGQAATQAAAAESHMVVLPPLSLSALQVGGMVGVAFVVLMTLFLLIRFGVPIVYFILPLYTIASWSAYTGIVFGPLLHRLAPALEQRVVWTPPACVSPQPVSAAACVATTLGLILPLAWLLTRLQPTAWVLQDINGIVVCCMFLTQLKLHSLRTAALIFGAFFVYDIFMVFITPYIFGSSVMVEVATAGQPTPVPNWACFCRQNPGDAKSCGPAEYMPILLRIPRIGDYTGGFAMLGLGDIVVPGLLMSLALRFDIDQKGFGRVYGIGYWPASIAGYCLGLALANVAIVVMQAAQPALLYLCPTTFAAVAALAAARQDFADMWRGPRQPPAGTDAMSDSGSEGGAVPLTASQAQPALPAAQPQLDSDSDDDERSEHAGLLGRVQASLRPRFIGRPATVPAASDVDVHLPSAPPSDAHSLNASDAKAPNTGAAADGTPPLSRDP